MPSKYRSDRFLKPNILVVEGDDEFEFCSALLRELKIDTIQIWVLEGKSALRGFLSNARNTVGFDELNNRVTAMGIIHDADTNPRGAFDSICSALQRSNFPIPHHPLNVTEGELKVSILILPDAQSPGMLEDLILASLQDDPSYACIEDYFACLTAIEGYLPPKNPAKARLLAYLASKPETDPRLGLAAQKGYWPWEHPVFDEIKQFLQTLGGV